MSINGSAPSRWQFPLTVQRSPAVLCAVIPDLYSEGDAARCEVAHLASRNGVRIGFAGSCSCSDELDVVIAASVAEASACSPAFWTSITPPPPMLHSEDIDAASRLLALAFDGWPEGKAVSPALLPTAVLGFLNELEQARPLPPHPLLSLLARPAEPPASVSLPLGMFCLDSRHADKGLPRERIGLTGRARYLLYGAYHWLPRGAWTATIVFSVDQDATGHLFRIEWGGVSAFSQHVFRTQQPGKYKISITTVVDQATQAELRLVLANSSLAGELTILGVELASGAAGDLQPVTSDFSLPPA